jgi:outer membrane receptor protein involved in Fe transport
MLTGLVWAQSQFVSGTVRDQEGLAVYGARVELVLAGKNVETTSTGRDGSFRFAMLPGTTARIRVTAPGFSDLEIPASSEVLSIILTPAVVAERVTVTGIDSRLGDTPQSVVLIARDDVVSDAAPTLDQKLRQIPGFTLFRRSDSRTANPTSQGVSLRGTGGSGASRAAVTTDGFPLNDPFGGWVYWGRIPLESVGEVEVLRGSAGEISGNSTIGGVIAMSTRRPDSGPRFDLDSSLGSQNTAIGSLYTAAAIGRLRASLAAEAFRTDGFIAVAPNERGAVDTRSDVDRASILPTVEYHLPGSGSIFFIGG